jgi:hypothetical protein
VARRCHPSDSQHRASDEPGLATEARRLRVASSRHSAANCWGWRITARAAPGGKREEMRECWRRWSGPAARTSRFRAWTVGSCARAADRGGWRCCLLQRLPMQQGGEAVDGRCSRLHGPFSQEKTEPRQALVRWHRATVRAINRVGANKFWGTFVANAALVCCPTIPSPQPPVLGRTLLRARPRSVAPFSYQGIWS